MARWSESQSHEVIIRGRMDGEYYSHPARQIETQLLSSPLAVYQLRQCCHRITSGHTPLRHDLTVGDVRFITVECVLPLLVNYALAKRVRFSHYSGELKRVALSYNSVVVSIKRRIANAAPCYNLVGATAVNQDIAVLNLRPGWTPGYVAAYLSSRFGQQLADREKTEQMNPYLPVGKLGNLLIPRIADVDQEDVDRLIRLAFGELSKRNDALDQAHNLLDKALRLDQIAFEKRIAYEALLSDVGISRRFDSEHHYPAFKAFKESLPDDVALSPLSQHLTFCQRGKQPIYSTVGLPVVNSKHVQPNRVLMDDNRSALPNADANLQIRFGDILLNGTGRGTLGRAAPYLNERLAVPDNHVTILRSADLDPVYLSLYLNSAAGQMQVEMHQRGTSGQLELYPFDIRKFLIWPAPKSLQMELRELHDKAAAAARESKRLLEQAKTRVEQLIEEAARA